MEKIGGFVYRKADKIPRRKYYGIKRRQETEHIQAVTVIDIGRERLEYFVRIYFKSYGMPFHGLELDCLVYLTSEASFRATPSIPISTRAAAFH